MPINQPEPPGLLRQIPVRRNKAPPSVVAQTSVLPTLTCLKPVVFGAESIKLHLNYVTL